MHGDTVRVMRVAISGSTGLIGTALAVSLRGDGHSVVGISRRPGPDVLTWDLDAGELDPSGLVGVDAVVNLAGESIQGRWTTAKKERIMKSRIDATDLLVRTLGALEERPSVFVSGSAMGYYGDRGDELLAESSGPGSGFLADVAQAWERSAAGVEPLGVRLACARTSIVLSPDGVALRRMKTITKFGLGGPLGGGRQFWSWITLDDQVRALRLLIETDIEGPVNLATPNPVRQGDFAASLAAALHRPAIVPAPRFAIRAALGEMGEALLLDSTRLEPTVLDAAGFRFESPDLESAFASMFPD